MNLEAALAFVRNEGNTVERARLGYLLDNAPVSQEAVKSLLTGQRSDGGWAPFWAADYSSLDATCFRLAQAEQMGLINSETAITEASQFLSQRQRPDGSWEEEKIIASVAPPWIKPGNLASRLYLTANCGFWLAVLTETNEATLSAASYIQTHLDETGSLPASLHAHWLAGGLWFRLNWQDSAQQVLTRLDQQLADLPASNLAWLIITLLVAGILSVHPLVKNAALLLEDCQTIDGYWLSEDGTKWDVHSTVEALRALRLCGRF